MSEQNKKKFVSLKEIDRSNTNPFMLELKGKMYLQPRANTILAKGEAIIDTITGEKKDESLIFGRRKIVDRSHFAKIYSSEISLFFDMSKTATNVLIYLSKIMDYENKALFNYMKDYEKIGYKTYQAVLSGLRELITKNIIYPHEINMVWWVNPVVICKGERFAKYTEFVTNEYVDKEQQKRSLKEAGAKWISTDQEYKIDLANKKAESQYNQTGKFKTNSEDDYK